MDYVVQGFIGGAFSQFEFKIVCEGAICRRGSNQSHASVGRNVIGKKPIAF
jgi:hypothetical protein